MASSHDDALAESMSSLSMYEATDVDIADAEELVAQVLRGAKTNDKQTVYVIADLLKTFWPADSRSMLLPPMNGFQRRIAHKIADLDRLGHVVDASGHRVVYNKLETSKDSGKLARIIAKHREQDAQPKMKLKLMKRQPANTSTRPAAHPHKQKGKSSRERTLSQREEEYNKARAAIFEAEQAESAESADKTENAGKADKTVSTAKPDPFATPSDMASDTLEYSRDIPRDVWAPPSDTFPLADSSMRGVWGTGWTDTSASSSLSTAAFSDATPVLSKAEPGLNPYAEGFVPSFTAPDLSLNQPSTAPAPTPNVPPPQPQQQYQQQHQHQQTHQFQQPFEHRRSSHMDQPWANPQGFYPPMYPAPMYGMPMGPPGMYSGNFPSQRPPALRQRKLYDPS
eukprot:TRINITY_DN11929_c0_g3_i4.p2 TRINITY_DN11929_c0_g3~~TRINITY_DN11929_c0_g3_i4.p2  ORF type:complete len:397 (+),score=72.28 TRINITY_DN11929_c0_g3_i4:201-1391(+)